MEHQVNDLLTKNFLSQLLVEQRIGSTSVLLNDKIYVFGGYQKAAGGGIFGNTKRLNDLFALDLGILQLFS